ncbi:MAG: ATP-binding protein [Bacteroidota bacterium]
MRLISFLSVRQWLFFFYLISLPWTAHAQLEGGSFEQASYSDDLPYWDYSFEHIEATDTIYFKRWWQIAHPKQEAKDRLARLAIGQSIAYLRAGKIDQYQDWQQAAFQSISQLPDSLQQAAFLKFGVALRELNYPIAALNAYNRVALSIDQATYPELSLTLYHHLNQVYLSLDDLQLSLEMAQKGIELITERPELQQAKYTFLRLELLKGIGLYYSLNGDFDLANSYYDQASQLDLNKVSPNIVAYLYTSIGQSYTTQGDYEQALHYLLLADSLNRSVDQHNQFTLSELGYLYNLRGEFELGIPLLEQQLNNALQNQLPNHERICLNYLAPAYAALGRYSEAYAAIHRAKKIQDAQQLRTAQAGGMTVLRNYLEAQKENQALVLSQEKEVALLQANQNRNWLLAVLGLCLISIMWALRLDRTKQKLEASRDALQRSEASLLEANLAKNNLLAVIGHDLKAPLARSKNRITQLRSAQASALPPDYLKELAYVEHSLGNLQDLIHQLVNWAAFQSKKLVYSPEEVAVADLLNQEVSYLHDLAIAKGVTLDISCEDWGIQTDPRMLSFILRNFLLNAIKFSNSGETIMVDFEALHFSKNVSTSAGLSPEPQRENSRGNYTKPSVNSLLLSVKDQGSGMTNAEIQQLFVMGAKHYSRRNNQASYGLGLHLAQKFAKSMKADIRVESKKGEGSTFFLEIPGPVFSYQDRFTTTPLTILNTEQSINTINNPINGKAS